MPEEGLSSLCGNQGWGRGRRRRYRSAAAVRIGTHLKERRLSEPPLPSPSPRDPVVTGMGLLSQVGTGVTAHRNALKAGTQVPFSVYEPGVQCQTGCQLVGAYRAPLDPRDLGLDRSEARFMGRMSLLAVRAARIALDQSGLPTRDLAVVVGTGTGEIETHREVVRRVARGGRVRVLPTTIPRIMASTVSANLATVLKTRGPSLSVTAACAGGGYNLAIAASWIREGIVDHALAGGVEAEDVHFHLGFDSMRAYTRVDNHRPEWASRPYAADRAGFIFGEGAGILALESRESAERRGAEILGSIRGFGMSSDGSGEMVAPASEGAELAIRRALRHGGVPPEAIGYINTHGTSTPLGDISEVRAIRRVFGDVLVPYGSTKGYTGHTVSAAGALEAAFTFLMLREGWLSPSVNAEPLDPELEDYPPVVRPTATDAEWALSNSFGFGGTNVSLVLRRER